MRTNLHGVPWLKSIDQVQTVIWFFRGWSPAAELVAVEQTPATGPEARQHGRCSVFMCLKSKINHPERTVETSWQLQHHFTIKHIQGQYKQVFSHKIRKEPCQHTHQPTRSNEADVTLCLMRLTEMIWVLKVLNTIILFHPSLELHLSLLLPTSTCLTS